MIPTDSLVSFSAKVCAEKLPPARVRAVVNIKDSIGASGDARLTPRVVMNTARFRRIIAPTVAGALFICVAASARAQTTAPGLDPRKSISQYAHDAWTIDEGLPQSSVLTIAQGSDGYLWLGTEAGLVRFDGVTFTTYSTANTPHSPTITSTRC